MPFLKTLFSVLLALGISASAANANVVVSSKIDTEGSVLAQIIRLLLEQEGIAVEDRSGFGTTSVVRAALLAAIADMTKAP